MKSRLVFDVTDAASILASDSVGAFLRSSDGTLITHTDVSGKKALDVRIAEGINVEVDLSHVDDSVRLGDGTSFFTSTSENGDISLDVHISNSDLDIRDLSAAQDNIASWTHDGTGTAITSTGTSLDVNVTGGTINVNDAALANTAIAAQAETLDAANTAQDIIVSPLANRKYLYILNNDNNDVFIGQSGVTAASGFPIPPSALLELRAGSAIDIEFVSSKSGHEIRTLELS